MNDERTAERTQHLMPELDACAAAILVYEQAFLALQSCSWVRSAKRSRLEFELRRAECGWHAAKLALNSRVRELGIEKHAAKLDHEAARRAEIIYEKHRRLSRAAIRAAQQLDPGAHSSVVHRDASRRWAGKTPIQFDASRMKRLGDV